MPTRMNAKTLAAKTEKARLESIAHWERMRADPMCGEEPYADDCALCTLLWDRECESCPGDCGNSPWRVAARAWRTLKDGTGTLERWRLAAQAEIDFLKSRKPKKRAKKKVSKK